jgi:hypothetical protein
LQQERHDIALLTVAIKVTVRRLWVNNKKEVKVKKQLRVYTKRLLL